MKTVALLGTLLLQVFLICSAHAQVPNARRLTQRVAPQPPPPQPRPLQTNAPAQTAPGIKPVPGGKPLPVVPGTPAIARQIRTQAVVRLPRPPVDPVKAKAAKEEAVRKTVEFQKKRASEGFESAQYELGLRYLKGDGVPQDEMMGRKWLRLSAVNGYGPAIRKVEELDRPPGPPEKPSESDRPVP